MHRIIEIDKEKYNQCSAIIPHFVQSPIWGSFKESTGSNVMYLEEIDEQEQIVAAWMLYIRTLPIIGKYFKIGVISQCILPTPLCIQTLTMIAHKEHLFFIKIEPLTTDPSLPLAEGLVKGTDYFLRNTFILDMQGKQSFDQIFTGFSTSARRNIRIAEKKRVQIEQYTYQPQDYSHIDEFLMVQTETIKRHQFLAHNEVFFHTLYDICKEHLIIFHARYQNEIIASLILYTYGDTCYYPHGASLHKYIETNASSLLVSEAIKYAFVNHFRFFNFWGALSSQPDIHHPLYGVHTFKERFGGTLHEYVGGYDLVIHHPAYKVFNTAYALAWKLLHWRNLLKR